MSVRIIQTKLDAMLLALGGAGLPIAFLGFWIGWLWIVGFLIMGGALLTQIIRINLQLLRGTGNNGEGARIPGQFTEDVRSTSGVRRDRRSIRRFVVLAILAGAFCVFGLAAFWYGLALEFSTGGGTPTFWDGVYFVWLGLATLVVTGPIGFGIAYYELGSLKGGRGSIRPPPRG